jgi:hypothetical protein
MGIRYEIPNIKKNINTNQKTTNLLASPEVSVFLLIIYRIIADKKTNINEAAITGTLEKVLSIPYILSNPLGGITYVPVV